MKASWNKEKKDRPWRCSMCLMLSVTVVLKMLVCPLEAALQAGTQLSNCIYPDDVCPHPEKPGRCPTAPCLPPTSLTVGECQTDQPVYRMMFVEFSGPHLNPDSGLMSWEKPGLIRREIHHHPMHDCTNFISSNLVNFIRLIVTWQTTVQAGREAVHLLVHRTVTQVC